jgi:hypothetical protein
MRKKRLAAATLSLIVICAVPVAQLQAFCGFYVAKADAQLFNKASKVVIAHDGDKNVVTMASDYQGDPQEFAVVIPVPTVITKQQVHITENALVDHLDAYTAPRLVEYFDEDPCAPRREYALPMAGMALSTKSVGAAKQSADSLGVKIEAQYTVGEYDILILSATQSTGLLTWLNQEGYKIPAGAADVLGSYIKQGMKFFVAKVNLKEQEKLGFHFLRPIQVAYESSKFMLPIRLGTVNARSPQELFVFTLSPKGRIETTNYRTVKIPSGVDVPLYTKRDFGPFYRAMFDTQVGKESMRTVFLEYSWNLGFCDPCSADPIANDKLIELGAYWLVPASPSSGVTGPRRYNPNAPQSATYVTRLHIRYDREHFPEDLMLQETTNRENFQGRYVMHHPWTGEANCPAGDSYVNSLPQRFSREAENLAALTGWELATIHRNMEETGQSFDPAKVMQAPKWYEQLWSQ